MRVDRRGGADSGLPPIATRGDPRIARDPRTGTVAPSGIGPVHGPGADLMRGHRRPGTSCGFRMAIRPYPSEPTAPIHT